MKRELRAEAKRLRAEGHSLRDIAARLGISLSSASVWTRGIARAPVAVAAQPQRHADAPPKHCGRCDRTQPASKFNRGQWWCRACFRRYYVDDVVRHRRRANELKRRRVAAAQAYVLELLRRTPCMDCGEADPVVLEFDHVGPKEAHVSTLVARGVRLARIAAEIDRCEVVCASCHRRRTARRSRWRRLDRDLHDARWRSTRHERNVRHVFAVLESSACADCGQNDMCVLDFDHVGEKTGSVMRLARNEVSLARLSAEIDRCEVRCANCHRRRTALAAAYFTTR